MFCHFGISVGLLSLESKSLESKSLEIREPEFLEDNYFSSDVQYVTFHKKL